MVKTGNPESFQGWEPLKEILNLCLPNCKEIVVRFANVLQLRQMQRFDLMAIPAKTLDERKAATKMSRSMYALSKMNLGGMNTSH